MYILGADGDRNPNSSMMGDTINSDVSDFSVAKQVDCDKLRLSNF